MSPMKKCPKCNLTIENDSARFCKKCGTNVENVPIIIDGPPLDSREIEHPAQDVTSSMTAVENPCDVQTSTHTYKPEINGFFAFVLWMVLIGGLLTPIAGLASFNISDYNYSLGLIISDISMYLLTPVVAIYSVVSTYKRRPGSVILLKSYLTYILAYKVFTLVISGFEDVDPATIAGLVWNLIFLLYICFSEKVNDNFPKETRKASVFDKVLIWCYILIPVVTFILGCLELLWLI